MTATLIEPPSTHVEPASGWVDDLMFEFAISPVVLARNAATSRLVLNFTRGEAGSEFAESAIAAAKANMVTLARELLEIAPWSAEETRVMAKFSNANHLLNAVLAARTIAAL